MFDPEPLIYKLVRSKASLLARLGLDVEDARQVMRIALWRSGVTKPSHVNRIVSLAFIDWLRAETKGRAVVRPRAVDWTTEQWEAQTAPSEGLSDPWVREALEKISPAQRAALDAYAQGETLKGVRRQSAYLRRIRGVQAVKRILEQQRRQRCEQ